MKKNKICILLIIVLSNVMYGQNSDNSPALKDIEIISQEKYPVQATYSNRTGIYPIVIKDTAEIRDKPLKSSVIIDFRDNGDTVNLNKINHTNGWYQVWLGGNSYGYINGYDIAFGFTDKGGIDGKWKELYRFDIKENSLWMHYLPSSFKKSYGHAEVWIRRVPMFPKKFKYMKKIKDYSYHIYHSSVNCKSETYTDSDYVFYNSKNEVVKRLPSLGSFNERVIPGTVGQAILRNVCNL